MKALLGDMPATRYTRGSGVDIAYQVVGDGPFDVVFAGGWVTHLELAWQQPRIAHFYRRLAAFSRLILFDKRGTGLSERFAADRPPTLDERMDDVRAVMDAVGSQEAALLGVSEGGAMSVLFAATYPERTRALVLYGTYARRVAAPDFPYGPPADEWEAYIASLGMQWGGPAALDLVAPSMSDDPLVADWWATYLRSGATPGIAMELLRMNAEVDVRPILGAVRAPTLILHREGDRAFPVAMARHLAEHIPDARLVVLPGTDHQFWAGDSDAVADEVETFLTGTRGAARGDRILATLLFTDIVDSTRQLAELGDAAWRVRLGTHDTIVRETLARFGGLEVGTTGDGFVARFDRPGRAVLAAFEIREALRRIELSVRIGIHTSEVELVGGDLRGLGMHIAARVMALAGPGGIYVTRTVRDLVAGSGITFADRGAHELKGIPGEWDLAEALSAP